MNRTGVVRALAVLVLSLMLAAETANAASPGMVVSDHHLASEVGARILEEGGTAVDAAVATAFALAVVLPSAGNLGGGGFLLHHGPREVTSFDFREKAPRAATETMFLGPDGRIRDDANHTGPLAVGVPGTVAGLWLAHQRFGRLPWARLVQPAVDFAEAGFPWSWRDAAWAKKLGEKAEPRYDETKRVFLDAGRVRDPGELFRQPDLARTLARIRDEGHDGFYRGETARLLAAFMADIGGLITEQDLRDYAAVERKPIHGTYRGYDVWGMGPPSSAGIALVTMLNILGSHDLLDPGHNTAPYLHLLAETMRRAYADRARFLGDPDFFAEMPVAFLTSQEHADALGATIDLHAASPSDSARFSAVWLDAASEETTHLCVVDLEGAVVSLTYTLEQGYGSSLTVPGAGFLLNNEMGDFNAIPGRTDGQGKIGTAPNLVRPGRRMLSSMAPTILARDGKPVLVIGTPGGRTIINSVLQVILNVVDHGMTLRQAIEAPRIHHQWLPNAVYFENVGFPPELRREVAAFGHQVRFRKPQGKVMGILIDPTTGSAEGVADSRSFAGGVSETRP